MAKHVDAIGYLLEVRDYLGSPKWFACLCDLAITSTNGTLTPDDVKRLQKLFHFTEEYTATAKPSIAIAAACPKPESAKNWLVELGEFKNYKRLADTLSLKITKRVTLIFGTNGAGKSSLCDAIKTLSSPEKPKNPIKNVSAPKGTPSKFVYKFEADAAPREWNETCPYGLHSGQIKYFDSSIAVRHVASPPSPKEVIEIAPFRLEVFSFAGQMVKQFKAAIEAVQGNSAKALAEEIVALQVKFASVDPAKLRAIFKATAEAYAELEKEVSEHAPLTEADRARHAEDIAEHARLEAACSGSGTKILNLEITALTAALKHVQDFKHVCAKADIDAAKEGIRRGRDLRATQKELAVGVFPDGANVEAFKSFIASAQFVVDFQAPGTDCPLCRSPLGDDQVTLLKKYHLFLTSKVEGEIKTLAANVTARLKELEAVRDFAWKGIDGDFVEANQKLAADTVVARIRNSLPTPMSDIAGADAAGFSAVSDLASIVTYLEREIKTRQDALALAKGDIAAFKAKRDEIAKSIAAFKYRELFDGELPALKKLAAKLKAHNLMSQLVEMTNFTNVLRQITKMASFAHDELVVDEFQKRLDDEYVKLCGAKMDKLGIRLTKKGENQAIILDADIAGNPIDRVLSEGERKVHALALFFAELAGSSCQITVFDDPADSFDYNNCDNFASRLRDLIRERPDLQIIVLTHNWHFFIQMQIVLSWSNMKGDLSVMVLEGCATVDEYAEEIVKLKQQISIILAGPDEPDLKAKSECSGLLRRLIESVVNTHSFNSQRYQFKQKSLKLTDFNGYTKLVPLTNTEAAKFRDLYGELSVPEHDDVRNFYMSKTKLMYQKWFQEIQTIESDVASRRP